MKWETETYTCDYCGDGDQTEMSSGPPLGWWENPERGEEIEHLCESCKAKRDSGFGEGK